MKMDLRGKRAIVTGAGGGIGRSIALLLEGQGVHVMLCGRSEEKLKKTTEQGSGNGKFAICPGDLLEEEYIAGAVQAAKEQLGGIDFVVNNAGLAHNMPFEQIPTDLFDTIMATNVLSLIHI